jgi:hypothetical protein
MRRIPGLLSTVVEVAGGVCVVVGVEVLAGSGWAWVAGGVLAAGFGYLGGVQ